MNMYTKAQKVQKSTLWHLWLYFCIYRYGFVQTPVKRKVTTKLVHSPVQRGADTRGSECSIISFVSIKAKWVFWAQSGCPFNGSDCWPVPFGCLAAAPDRYWIAFKLAKPTPFQRCRPLLGFHKSQTHRVLLKQPSLGKMQNRLQSCGSAVTDSHSFCVITERGK